MSYDLRDFVGALREAGELIEIDDEVDWKYELPAYGVISGRFGGPAFLFNNIKGIPKGRKVLTGHFIGTNLRPHRRIALALGMDPKVDFATWYQQLAVRFNNTLRPVEVATGSCKEVVLMGKDINLLEWPFTYHAVGDGGRYMFINATVIKDPDSDWINSGLYAIAVFSRNRLVITAYAHTNFMSIFKNKYEARNQSMPVAVCLGGDPAVTFGAMMVMPPGITEYDVAGGIRGRPVELVRAETSDLLIPADAEVVIEGEVRPYEMLPEGPKIESFGFSTGPRKLFWAMRVNCITHRKDPIIWDVHTSMGSDAACVQSAISRLGTVAAYRIFGIPCKIGMGAIVPGSGGTSQHPVYKKKYPENYPGFMTDVIQKAVGFTPVSLYAHQFFCDDDVNILDLSEFYEAMFTQVNPKRDMWLTSPIGIITLESSWMEPWDIEHNVGGGHLLGKKMIYDATTKEEPPQGVRRLNFETLFPEEIQKKVVENWGKWGFEEEPRWNKSWVEAKF